MPTTKGESAGAHVHAPGHFEIEGHSVEIRLHEQGHEALWIDGRRQAFFVTPDGYTLHADAYAKPAATLVQAVKKYLKKRPKIEPNPGHGGHGH